MHHSINHGLHFCVIGGSAIFLDLPQDRYLRLSKRLTNALLFEGSDDPEAVRQLLERGIVSPSQDPAPPQPARATRPQRSLYEEHETRQPKLIDVIEAWVLIGAFTLLVGRRPLQKLIAQKSSRGSVQSGRQDAARRFIDARSNVPIKHVCLADSLAMRAFMRRRGDDAQLVFGVKQDPFAAHCWLQADNIVLNDALDHANLYTPIMVSQ